MKKKVLFSLRSPYREQLDVIIFENAGFRCTYHCVAPLWNTISLNYYTIVIRDLSMITMID